MTARMARRRHPGFSFGWNASTACRNEGLRQGTVCCVEWLRFVALDPGSRCACPGHVIRVPAEAVSAFTRVFDALWAQPEREPGSRGETAQCTLLTRARVSEIAQRGKAHP